MKKVYFVPIIIIVVAVLVITGCTPSMSTPPVSPSPASSPSVTTVKTLELKFASHIPGRGSTYELLKQWTEKIYDATKGSVKVTLYMGGSLIQKDLYSSTVSGICDITTVPVHYEPSWQMEQALMLPELQFPDGVKGAKAIAQLHKQFPVLDTQFKDTYPLCINSGIALTGIHTKKAVRVPQDIKNMKLVTTGKQEAEILQNAGAIPVTLGSAEWYMSVERNLVEGVLGPYVVAENAGVNSLLPNHIKLNYGPAGVSVWIMNLKRWNSLSPDVQKVFNDLSPWLIEQSEKNDDIFHEGIFKQIIASGGKIPDLTEAELNQWKELAKPLTQNWIKANQSVGPAGEIVQYIQKMLQQPEYSTSK